MAPRHRRLPGPCGLLGQGATLPAAVKAANQKPPSQVYSVCTQDEDPTTLVWHQGPWQALCSALDLPPPPSDPESISHWFRENWACCLDAEPQDPRLRMARVAAVIASMSRDPAITCSGAFVVVSLKDPTGHIDAFFHPGAVAEHVGDISEGAAVLLKDVSIAVSVGVAGAATRSLCVHPASIACIFQASAGGDAAGSSVGQGSTSDAAALPGKAKQHSGQEQLHRSIAPADPAQEPEDACRAAATAGTSLSHREVDTWEQPAASVSVGGAHTVELRDELVRPPQGLTATAVAASATAAPGRASVAVRRRFGDLDDLADVDLSMSQETSQGPAEPRRTSQLLHQAQSKSQRQLGRAAPFRFQHDLQAAAGHQRQGQVQGQGKGQARRPGSGSSQSAASQSRQGQGQDRGHAIARLMPSRPGGDVDVREAPSTLSGSEPPTVHVSESPPGSLTPHLKAGQGQGQSYSQGIWGSAEDATLLDDMLDEEI
ncbi:unnamed protein product [Chrysoparadoxa australica]